MKTIGQTLINIYKNFFKIANTPQIYLKTCLNPIGITFVFTHLPAPLFKSNCVIHQRFKFEGFWILFFAFPRSIYFIKHI